METKASHPSWIDKNYIEKILKIIDGSYEFVDHLISIPNTKLGMSSERFVASISYKDSQGVLATKKVIIKTKPTKDGLKKDIVQNCPLFQTEMSVMADVLPKMNEVLKKAGDTKLLHPRIFYYSTEPTPNIVMEYFDPETYKCEFEKLNNLKEAEPLVELMAKFHAASYYLAEQENVDLSKYDKSIYDNPENVERFIKETLQALKSTMISSWESGEKYVEKIDFLIAHCERIGKNAYIPNKSGSGFKNVLCHSDYHLGNMLRNKKDPSDLYLIDFQTVCWCSPAVDFYYAFFQLSEDLRKKCMKEMAAYYHKIFKKTLENTGFSKPIPTLEDFEAELQKHREVRTLFTTCFEPFAFSNFNEATIDDLNNFELKKKLFENKECEAFLVKELAHLIEENLI